MTPGLSKKKLLALKTTSQVANMALQGWNLLNLTVRRLVQKAKVSWHLICLCIHKHHELAFLYDKLDRNGPGQYYVCFLGLNYEKMGDYYSLICYTLELSQLQ